MTLAALALEILPCIFSWLSFHPRDKQDIAKRLTPPTPVRKLRMSTPPRSDHALNLLRGCACRKFMTVAHVPFVPAVL
jgi:hypothetical protein